MKLCYYSNKWSKISKKKEKEKKEKKFKSPTIMNSFIYNDLAIQNIFFFCFILELHDLNYYLNVASTKHEAPFLY